MALISGADNHYLAVTLDKFAFIAHGFNTGSYFHNKNLPSFCCAI